MTKTVQKPAKGMGVILFAILAALVVGVLGGLFWDFDSALVNTLITPALVMVGSYFFYVIVAGAITTGIVKAYVQISAMENSIISRFNAPKDDDEE